MAQCELGRTYKDKVTGVTGVAMSRTEWLGGCVRVGIQPRAREGTVPKMKEFDEPQLEQQAKAKIEVPSKPDHGPRPSPKRR